MADEESGWGKIIDGTADVVTRYKLLEKLAHFFVNGREVVLLCGTSGAGKSQFIRSFQDGVSTPIPTTERTRGWRRAKVTKDKRRFELLDTPGQIGEGPIRRKAHLEALKAKRFGIINVVANGYHEGTASEGSAIAHTGSEYQVRPEFLAQNLEVEIENLAEWSVELMDAKWLITLVNKADLWWHPDTRESVLNHYSGNGAYGKILKSWQGKHIVLPYASTSKTFYDRVAMSGYFGDAQRLQCQVTAFQTLTSLIEQSKKK
jgi:hypothetical protein